MLPTTPPHHPRLGVCVRVYIHVYSCLFAHRLMCAQYMWETHLRRKAFQGPLCLLMDTCT